MLDAPVSPLGVFERHFHDLRPLLDAAGPAWVQSLRERSLEEWSRVGLPTTRDEEFRYLPLHGVEAMRLRPARGAHVERTDLAPLPLGGLDAITLTFVNGQYAPELSSADRLPDGAELIPLEEAYNRFPERLERWLGKIATLEGRLGSTNDERFVHLNSAFLQEGAVLSVGRGVALERPVHVRYVSTAARDELAIFPRMFVWLDEAATAKLVESHVGLSGTYLTVPVAEVFVGRGANLEHLRHQDETPSAFHVGTLAVWQEADSVYTSNVVQFGATTARLDLNVWLDGSHTETWLNGASVGRGEQRLDNHTRLDHAHPECNSFEVYKTILDDRAHGVFNGKIFVYQDAQKTDAKQTNQGLLLSPTATFDTKPQLEIFADDVKCTHGATVGQLREDALFYLRARGVPKREAEALLVYAFAAEVLERITIPDAREALEKRLFEKLR